MLVSQKRARSSMTVPGPLDSSRRALQEYVFKFRFTARRDRELAIENWCFLCTENSSFKNSTIFENTWTEIFFGNSSPVNGHHISIIRLISNFKK